MKKIYFALKKYYIEKEKENIILLEKIQLKKRLNLINAENRQTEINAAWQIYKKEQKKYE